jgi:hypothetical protein
VFKYIKAAFIDRWNMLVFLGATGFALLSGRPDIALPLVLAGETVYLGLLGTHPKFQRHVDAQEAKQAREAGSQVSDDVFRRMVTSLPDASRRRYAALLESCQHLRQIALDLKQPGQRSIGAPLDSLQSEGLDRLLWIYLRLLFTEHSLTRFLEHTDRLEIEREAKRLESKLAPLAAKDQSPHSQKVRRTLEDSLVTTRGRLENLDRAQSNHEFVQLEIERLENKIKSLAELAVNRQEPDYISGQIDQVAHSMLDTEKTMNELQYVTGLDAIDDTVPPILQTVRAE